MPLATANPRFVRSLQQPAEARRGQVERGVAVQAQIFQVFGRVDLQGSGETTFETKFPVWFTEAPQMSFGAELAANQILTAGKYPRVNLLVRRWVQTRRGGTFYYTGAEFVVVVDGPNDMSSIAHWQCEGVGLTNPLFGTGGLDETL